MTGMRTLVGRAATLFLIGSMLAFGISVAGACDDSSAAPAAVDASSLEASSPATRSVVRPIHSRTVA